MNLKLPNQLIEVHKNGLTFRMDPDNPGMRFFGGGGSSVKQVDPLAGTGVRQLYPSLTGYLNQNIGPVSAYPGQITPGPSTLQQAGFDLARSLTPIASGGQEYAGDLFRSVDSGIPGRALTAAEGGIQSATQPFDPSMVTDALEPGKRLAMDYFTQDLIPAYQRTFNARAGTPDSGAVNSAIVKEGARLALGLADRAYPYLFQGSENQASRNLQGAGMSLNLAGAPGQVLGQAGGIGMDQLSQLLNIGGMQREITGQQMYEPYQKWAYTQPYNNPWINALGTLTSGAPRLDTIVEQNAPSLGSQLLPVLGMGLGGYFAGGGTLAGMGSSLFGGGSSAAGTAASWPTFRFGL